MASSIVSTLSRIQTPDIVGQLAIASGLERSLAQAAIAVAVPSILSAFAGLVVRRDGAKQLARAVAAQPADILSSISRHLTASNLTGSTYMAITGKSLLASLLGDGALGTLGAPVARYAGIGEGSSQSLMGLLTPLIMGVLGREQRAAGLDANGLAELLTGQKKEITAAMPSGLIQLLEASGFYGEDVVARALSETDTHEAPPGIGYYAAATQRAPAKTTTWRATGPYWMLPLLALAVLLCYLLPREREMVSLLATVGAAAGPAQGVVGATAP